MAASAQINPAWKWKWIIMGVVMLAYGGWCIYDALVVYPAHDERANAFQELKRDKRDDAAWLQKAKEMGWDAEDPGPAHEPKDYTAQWWQLAVAWPGAIACFIWLGMNMARPLRTDESTISGPGGKNIPFSAVTAIDKTRWNSKGIAIVQYNHNGVEGEIKIDDWIYAGADDVLEDLEHHTGLVGESLETADET